MSASREQAGGRAPSEQRIAYEDVDDLIHTATRLMQEQDAARDTLTPEDLKRIGQDLDIPAEYIDRAMEVLARRREEEARARQADALRREQRKARLRQVAVGAAVVAGLLGLGGVSVRNGLNATLAQVQRQQAQVRIAVERRQRVQERYATSAPGPERDAQLSGADNRVAVEQRRYDALAATYNTSASAFPQLLVVPLTGLPSRLPLSSEVSTW